MKPVPDADTQPYWAGIAAGELRLQRCAACGLAVFYPRASTRARSARTASAPH